VDSILANPVRKDTLHVNKGLECTNTSSKTHTHTHTHTQHRHTHSILYTAYTHIQHSILHAAHIHIHTHAIHSTQHPQHKYTYAQHTHIHTHAHKTHTHNTHIHTHKQSVVPFSATVIANFAVPGSAKSCQGREQVRCCAASREGGRGGGAQAFVTLLKITAGCYES